jgi:hypothetical protein
MIKRPMSRASLAAVVVVLAACGSGASGSTEKRPAPRPRTLVTLEKSGGIAGISQHVVVRRSGRVVTSSRQARGGRAEVSHVGPRRLRGLRRAVRRASLPHRRTYTGSSPVADAFHYRLATPGHVVTWDSPGATPPRRITRLAARLEALGA